MSKLKTRQNRTKKLLWLVVLILAMLVLIFISSINNINSPRRLPSLFIKNTDIAVRGEIISRDNFMLSKSIKLYKATIFLRCLDKDKLSLFVKLFSIYSGIDQRTIKTKIKQNIKNGKTGTIVLSYNIGAKKAEHLKQLIIYCVLQEV